MLYTGVFTVNVKTVSQKNQGKISASSKNAKCFLLLHPKGAASHTEAPKSNLWRAKSIPLHEKQTKTNSSHSPSPGGSKPACEGHVPHLLPSVPKPGAVSQNPGQCPPWHLPRWATSRRALRKYLRSCWPKHTRDFPRGAGRIAGPDKVEKEKKGTERCKKFCPVLQ